jgi:hypothetical protein
VESGGEIAGIPGCGRACAIAEQAMLAKLRLLG